MTKIQNQIKPVFSLSDQVLCLHREVQMRWAVYPGRVLNGKITQDQMDREIGLMDAAAETLEKIAKRQTMFRETWNALAASRSFTDNQLSQELADSQARAIEYMQNGELAAAYSECVKVAGLTLRLAEVVSAQLKAATLAEAPAPTANPTPGPPARQRSAGPAPSPTAAVSNLPPEAERLTVEQKTEILKLANHLAIPRNKKTHVLLNINRLRAEEAAALIIELNKVIEDAEGPIVYRKAS